MSNVLWVTGFLQTWGKNTRVLRWENLPSYSSSKTSGGLNWTWFNHYDEPYCIYLVIYWPLYVHVYIYINNGLCSLIQLVPGNAENQFRTWDANPAIVGQRRPAPVLPGTCTQIARWWLRVTEESTRRLSVHHAGSCRTPPVAKVTIYPLVMTNIAMGNGP